MQIIRELGALRDAVRALRDAGQRIALVPTMGALHAGHIALVEDGLRRADAVVTSIFVNPMQFAPHEDMDRYPRRERADAQLLEKANAAILWAPSVEEIYPQGFATTVSVSGVSQVLDGAARPGHFDGVATVVLKLFQQVKPDVALFGEKDWQQLAVIRRMAADLDLDIEIAGVPTVRDDQGLALSSRNAYLDEEELASARTLPRALGEAAAAIGRGEPVAGALTAAVARLAEAGFDPIDYVSLRDAETLAPIETLGERPARLLAAARMGNARLIDNLPVHVTTSNDK
ncbi:pantoate--beta-alanine ligase [Sphingomonas oryzagri]|uniref:Pantothenate synthetase n=1 Tax=Sphingomonas oryzagri TaxID=3042314 RepID=A0ABT6N5I8_9SPHN|nr:pantoate--beta-alanine ligase [Sphingomonas oryzagri]MDH7640377.1 pantoate--beta-alanine ligase [Sphingomonas oryzagri]